MSGESEALTIGEIGRTLTRLDEGQKAILERIDLMRGEFVHRSEWDLRVQVTTREVAAVENDIRDLRAELVVEREAQEKTSRQVVIWRGAIAVLSVLFGVLVTVVASYIQSGRL